MAIINNGSIKYIITDITANRPIPSDIELTSPHMSAFGNMTNRVEQRVTITYAICIPNAAGNLEAVAVKSRTWSGSSANWLFAESNTAFLGVITDAEEALITANEIAGTIQ